MDKELMDSLDRERQVVLLRALAARIVSRVGLSGNGRSMLVTVSELDHLADSIARGEDSLLRTINAAKWEA